MSDLSSVQQARRRIRLFSWTGALLVGGILIALNFIFSYLPIRFDATQGRVYSISKGSKELLKKLDDTMVVKIVFSGALPAPYKLNEQYVSDLLSEYKRASNGKIRIEYLDPSSKPKGREEAMNAGISPVQMDVRERDRREVKECFMGVSFAYGDKRESIAVVQDTENLEYELTVRIKKLLEPERPIVGFVSSGEATTISSKSLESLMSPLFQLYQLREVDLTKPVEHGVKAVWLIAPNKPLEAAALANLRTYMSHGGTLGLLLNRNTMKIAEFRASPLALDLDEFLGEWGLTMRNGLVVDSRCDRIQIQAVQGAFRMINVVDYPYFPVVTDLDRSHPATKGLDGVSLPFLSPVEIASQKQGFTYTVLGRTSPMSFLDNQPSDLNPLRNHERPVDAAAGPFNIGVIAEGKFTSVFPSSAPATGSEAASRPARLIVVGTSHFIESEYPAKPSNYSFFINLMDWAVQDEALIQIRSRGFAQRPLKEYSDSARMFYKYVMMLGLPLLSVAIGLIVWNRQKMRRALLPLQYKED